MDCKQSEIYMMQHFEKTITPPNARELAKHVLICKKCRELYLTFDVAAEVSLNLTEAPENFTESVMTAVRAEARSKEITIDYEAHGQTVLRIIWGLGAVLFGFGLLLMFNPEWFNSLTQTYPSVEGIMNAIYSAGVFINGAAESISQGVLITELPISDGFAFAALAFAAVIGILLYVLHSGEKVKT
ncbi:MAG: hypothetical protein LBI27_01940 [Clostridiales bacterium]|jgi:hypothetical protein|nr:hypothetical protein [Clostridiales bacterium]